MLMTSAVALPQNSPPRIEQQAPPIPIAYAPPNIPVPVYGAPPVPTESSLISTSSINTNQSPVPTSTISAPPVQPERPQWSVSSTAPGLVERVPIRPPIGLIQVPENWVSIPKGSNQIVVPPGTIISLRDNWGQFSHG